MPKRSKVRAPQDSREESPHPTARPESLGATRRHPAGADGRPACGDPDDLLARHRRRPPVPRSARRSKSRGRACTASPTTSRATRAPRSWRGSPSARALTRSSTPGTPAGATSRRRGSGASGVPPPSGNGRRHQTTEQPRQTVAVGSAPVTATRPTRCVQLPYLRHDAVGCRRLRRPGAGGALPGRSRRRAPGLRRGAGPAPGVDDRLGIAFALNNLSNLLRAGDHAAARAPLEEGLALRRVMGDRQLAPPARPPWSSPRGTTRRAHGPPPRAARRVGDRRMPRGAGRRPPPRLARRPPAGQARLCRLRTPWRSPWSLPQHRRPPTTHAGGTGGTGLASGARHGPGRPPHRANATSPR